MEKLIDFYVECSHAFDFIRCSDDVKDFIICQFALESNFGKSRLAHDCNNFSGMRYPRVRISTCCEFDPKSDFAKYPSIYYCVVDFFLALQYHRPTFDVMYNIDSYKFFIKGWYCPERDYLDKITKLFNQLKIYKNEQKL